MTTPAGAFAYNYDGDGRLHSETNPFSETSQWTYPDTQPVSGVSGLVPELLRWRRYCRVEGGEVLRAAMAEEVQAMASLYEADHC